MSNRGSRSSRRSEPAANMRPLRIGDLLRYLSGLGKLNKDPRIGNAELSEALRQLVGALKPHALRPIDEIADVVSKRVSRRGRKASSEKPKVQLPSELRTLLDQKAEEILNDDRFTKSQLIELGTIRFGISRSRLMRLKKSGVNEAVRAALNHERSLDVISQEARAGGEKRSS